MHFLWLELQKQYMECIKTLKLFVLMINILRMKISLFQRKNVPFSIEQNIEQVETY
jgi:hypothetical protein